MGKKLPLGINIISILILISGILTFLIGVFFTIGYFAINTVKEVLPEILTVMSPILLVLGIVLILFGIFRFILFSALRKGRNWARWFIIIVESLTILGGIMSIISGNYAISISVIISGVIVGYLIFSKKVKRFYR